MKKLIVYLLFALAVNPANAQQHHKGVAYKSNDIKIYQYQGETSEWVQLSEHHGNYAVLITTDETIIRIYQGDLVHEYNIKDKSYTDNNNWRFRMENPDGTSSSTVIFNLEDKTVKIVTGEILEIFAITEEEYYHPSK